MIFTNRFIILIVMLFLHILADFHLQGILANLKQKKWWKEELEKYKFSYNEKEFYKNDWIPVLIIHSFEWTFIMMIPALFTGVNIWLYLGLLVFNTLFHFIIDDLKCNKYMLNLVADQLFHFIQVLVTWCLIYVIQLKI